MKPLTLTMLAAALVLTARATGYTHCEIPCGIYDDSARVDAMREDVTTIEKSMQQIIALSESDQPNYNQLVRWVTNKEEHAIKLQDIAVQYFQFQRLKPAEGEDPATREAYLTKLTLLHKITVEAMKAKQTTDLEHVTRLRSLIDEFEKAYLGM